MFCVNCGRAIPDDSKFCIYCGAAVEHKKRKKPANEKKKVIILALIAAVLLACVAALFFMGGDEKTDGTAEEPQTGENVEALRAELGAPEDAFYYGTTGHFYKLYDEPMKWTDARDRCIDMKGHLVTVTSAEEQVYIVRLIEDKGQLFHYWMGATDEDNEMGDRKWTSWITGEPMLYENWCNDQPNNNSNGTDPEAGQDYMEIQATDGNMSDPETGYSEYMTWTDIGNDGYAANFEGAPDYNSPEYYGYICEWGVDDPE